MSSKFVIMRNSAAPLNQKRTVLTQEGIRRLKNCKIELEWGQKAQHLSNLMQKMKNSGYDEKFWLEVLKSSINGYEKILEDHKSGSKPIYRNKDWKEKNYWKSKKIFKRENWWKDGGQIANKSVIFVPATPGSELINWLKKVEKDHRKQNQNSMNFKFIEQTGVSLENWILRRNRKKCIYEEQTAYARVEK